MTFKTQSKPTSKNSPYPWLFLAAYYLFCFLTYRDYGITLDEPRIYGGGVSYFRYYFTPWLMDNLATVEDATHNYLYPALLELFCSPGNYTGIHLLNLLFGSLIFIAAYQVLWACYQKRSWALAGCVVLFLTPRFLGELPANPKDAAFAVLYFAALAGIYLIPQRVPGWGMASFWIGILIGLATCVRILGLTLIPIYVFYQLTEYGRETEVKPKFFKWVIGQLPRWLLILFFSQFCMRMLWPYLDHDYFRGMRDIFKESRFYYWDGLVLFAGQLIHPTARLWAYLPVWFLITTPLFILTGFLFSFVAKKEKAVSSLWILLALAAGFNFGLYLILKPIIYNGLRHYLFLVPILSVMAVIGMIELYRGVASSLAKKATLGLVLLNILMVAVQCVRLYPYDYLYFNELIGGLPGAYGHYETDYEGASLKEATQWLSTVAAQNPNVLMNVKISASQEQCDYYFRSNMKEQDEVNRANYWVALNKEADFQLTPNFKNKVVHIVEREGVPLAYVLKMK
ncbi:MAG TPA: hypothetical protein VK791_10490 [bacterium]|nr:hypothetical protein [bacterium]